MPPAQCTWMAEHLAAQHKQPACTASHQHSSALRQRGVDELDRRIKMARNVHGGLVLHSASVVLQTSRRRCACLYAYVGSERRLSRPEMYPETCLGARQSR
jgi:hypothetical protein